MHPRIAKRMFYCYPDWVVVKADAIKELKRIEFKKECLGEPKCPNGKTDEISDGNGVSKESQLIELITLENECRTRLEAAEKELKKLEDMREKLPDPEKTLVLEKCFKNRTWQDLEPIYHASKSTLEYWIDRAIEKYL